MATNLLNRLVLLPLGLALAALPVRAQLDPRLQTSATDFLDLYQQTNSTTLKPEIVTVFDFSGSTQNLMYHGSFPNIDSTDVDNPNGGGQLKVTVTRSGSSPNFVYKVSATLAWKQYDPRNAQSSVTGTTPTLTFCGLLTPSGALVTSTMVHSMGASGVIGPNGAADSSNPKESDPINWILCASHARFRLKGAANTYVNTTTGATSPTGTLKSITYDRTIDIPLGWSVLGFNSGGTVTTNPDASPLKPLQADDTAGSTAAKFTYDTNYLNTSGKFWNGGGPAGSSATTAYCASVGYAPNYIGWLFQGTDSSGNFVVPAAGTWTGTPTLPETTAWTNFTTNTPGLAFANAIPGLTRSQSVKFAAIQTWIGNQKSVIWAYRFLDTGEPNSSSTISRDSVNSPPPALTTINASQTYGQYRGWMLFNGTAAHTTTAIQTLAGLFPNNSTPLTYAEANAYAQFQDSSSTGIFNAYETAANNSAPQDCMKHFLIVFTDGQPNSDGGWTTNGGSSNAPDDYTPYLDGTNAAPGTKGSADKGNGRVIAAGLSCLNPNQGNVATDYWNIQTLSAVAAHGADQTLTNRIAVPSSYPATGKPQAYAPFWVLGRGTTSGGNAVNGSGIFSTPHNIQTMTVGLSLGGSYTDAASGKSRLFQAAVFGDPAVKTWDLSTVTPFAFSNPSDPNSGIASNAAYFFDAKDPATLVEGLGAAFKAIKGIGTTAVASAPTTPSVGLSLANQVYLGLFTPPKAGGPVWSGDLLMYSTHTTSSNTYLIGSTGAAVGVPDATNSQWAASIIFSTTSANANQPAGNKNWSKRVVWTRLPATSTAPNPGLVRFEDGLSTTGNATAYSVIKNYVGPNTLTDAQRYALIDYVLGASTSSTTTPYANRSDIMGDIVDSAPTTLEYTWSTYSPLITSTVSSILSSAVGTANTAGNAGSQHFRLIFVGDNQGFMHAFGEVSWSVNKAITDPSNPSSTINIPVINGRVDELWAFLPTDFLANLNYSQINTNSHRFMVDGTPYAYFLDAPASNSISGNGTVDSGERAMIIFGLRKGGRSYYALDVSNPFQPRLGPNDANGSGTAAGWAIRADDASLITGSQVASTTTLANVKKVVGTMGFSSSQPFVGRVLTDGGTSTQNIRDAVFLGGGLSTPDVDAQLLNTSTTTATSSPLGRSALALDVNTGQYLMTWDLTTTTGYTSTTVGPVAAGVVPVVLDQTSGLASRAYMNDYYGNVWALGSAQPGLSGPTGDFSSFRIDSNMLDHWTKDGSSTAGAGTASMRKLYSKAPNNGLLSTLPAPFLIGGFPVVRFAAPQVSPYAVGVVINSGDRNNPLDRNYNTTTNIVPSQHRLTVLFDRQDNQTAITDSNLLDLSTATTANVTEGSGSFYLGDPGWTPSTSPSHGLGDYGYFINYPKLTTAYVNKAINDPLVVAYSLFFSYFEPTSSDPCTGGQGFTISSRFADVIQPPDKNSFSFPANPTPGATTGTGFSNPNSFGSGWVAVYSGVATNYSPQGTTSVSQGGTLPGGSNNTLALTIQNMAASATQRFPRPRTWRVIR